MNTKITMGRRCKVVIDGKTFVGNNIQIINDKVIIDGETQDGSLIGNVEVKVYGDVDSVHNTSGNVKADKVGNVKTTSGDVVCSAVSGGVTTTSGDVSCKSVGGNVRTTSGDVSRSFM